MDKCDMEDVDMNDERRTTPRAFTRMVVVFTCPSGTRSFLEFVWGRTGNDKTKGREILFWKCNQSSGDSLSLPFPKTAVR